MHYNQRRHSIWRVFTVVINPLAEKFLKTCLPVCLRERVRGNNTIWFLKIFIRGLLIEASFIPEMRKAVNAANKFLQFSPTTMCWRTILNVTQMYYLSSPRAKHAGPKGPRAESAGAVTGRRCPHSGRGEDFLSRQPHFFTETAVTPERKVEKSFPRWEINRHAEG